MTAPAASAPIGIFDSGLGGLSVWRQVVRQLPNESTLYFADRAHVPYGSRGTREIRFYSEAICASFKRTSRKSARKRAMDGTKIITSASST